MPNLTFSDHYQFSRIVSSFFATRPLDTTPEYAFEVHSYPTNEDPNLPIVISFTLLDTYSSNAAYFQLPSLTIAGYGLTLDSESLDAGTGVVTSDFSLIGEIALVDFSASGYGDPLALMYNISLDASEITGWLVDRAAGDTSVESQFSRWVGDTFDGIQLSEGDGTFYHEGVWTYFQNIDLGDRDSIFVAGVPQVSDFHVSGGSGDDSLSLGGIDTERPIMIDLANQRITTSEFSFTYDGFEAVLEALTDSWITGSDQSDLILGGSGNDTILAGAGNDTVSAGWGDDVVYAGAGHDELLAQTGDDTIFGSSTADRLNGGYGSDTFHLRGAGTFEVGYFAHNYAIDCLVNIAGFTRFNSITLGEDLATYTPSDYDIIILPDSHDALFAHDAFSDIFETDFLYEDNQGRLTTNRINGIEEIRAGGGNDIIDLATDSLFSSGSNSLLVLGEEGDDILWGRSDQDTLNGGEGDDTLYGGSGGDLLIGGAGADDFEFSGEARNTTYGENRIADFSPEEGDQLIFHNSTNGSDTYWDPESIQFQYGQLTIDFLYSDSHYPNFLTINFGTDGNPTDITLEEIQASIVFL